MKLIETEISSARGGGLIQTKKKPAVGRVSQQVFSETYSLITGASINKECDHSTVLSQHLRVLKYSSHP